jgi:hypothetical protein
MRVDLNGMAWEPCPICGQDVVQSHNGWQRHVPFCRPRNEDEFVALPPLDVDTFIAGLDSPNHSPESRLHWIGLFYRDLIAAALRAATPDPAPVRFADYASDEERGVIR